MVSIQLEGEEWQRVMHCIGLAPVSWALANPLLMKIGEQLKGHEDAAQERVRQGNGQLEHPRDDESGSPPQPGGRSGAEHRAEKPTRRT